MAWLERLSRNADTDKKNEAAAGVEELRLEELRVEELRAIAKLHYRLRFDPAPIDEASRRELRERVESWVARSRQAANA